MLALPVRAVIAFAGPLTSNAAPAMPPRPGGPATCLPQTGATTLQHSMSAPILLNDEMFAFGAFLLLPAQRTLLHDGQVVRLGSRALDILVVLVERAGDVVGKEELLARVWPNVVIDEVGLRVHIAALRKALGEPKAAFRFIANVPSRGYCFIAPVSITPAQMRSQMAPRPTPAPATTRLPLLMTRLFGRDDTIATLVENIAQRRLVSVVGPGGMGKTSVALAAAAQLEPSYAHGVHFIDLAALDDATLVPGTVAAVLGVPTNPDSVICELVNWLAERHLLIVLDNCEHVVSAVTSLVEDVLGRAPHCHIIATSREPLRTRGEWLHRLAALATPPPEGELSYRQALDFAAFELFVERATASLDGMALTDADTPQIAHLCRKLDGVPLAIELVAAQIGFYGLNGLASMLEGRLSLSMLGQRTAMPRHQTLRNTLDWSFELLSPAEQRVLGALAVFRERFTLGEAVGIVGERTSDTAHALMMLVSRSLVTAEPGDDEMHYRLLETTRSYAGEKLAASADWPQVARRHVQFCLAAVQRATLESAHRLPARWREQHCRRIDDVRAALQWALREGGDAELGAALAADSAAVYFAQWQVREYMGWLECARAALPASAVGERLDMQLSLEYGQASLALRGGAQGGLQSLERSARMAAQHGERTCQLSALWGCFSARLLRGEYREALRETETFGEVARSGDDGMAQFAYHRMMALCLHLLGEQASALTHARQALHPGATGMGHLHGNTYQLDHRTAALTQLARILWLSGMPRQALQAAHDAIEAALEAGHALSQAYALAYAACPIALWCGDVALAQHYIEALQRCTSMHSLVYWQSWPLIYRRALARHGAITTPLLPAEAAATVPSSQLDMLCTLHPDFIDDECVTRLHAGSNLWCAAEVLRALGQRAAAGTHADGAARGEALLREALALARSQGALGWALRAATSLARLLAPTRPAEAAAVLAAALAPFEDGQDSADLRAARQLQAQLPLPLSADHSAAPA